MRAVSMESYTSRLPPHPCPLSFAAEHWLAFRVSSTRLCLPPGVCCLSVGKRADSQLAGYAYHGRAVRIH